MVNSRSIPSLYHLNRGVRMKIGLLTDSTCDLSQELIDRYKIEIVPLTLHFGEDVFQDMLELTGEIFFKKMKESIELPTTSQPSIGFFVKKYQHMSKNYDAIISIHLSGKLSGTCHSARMAAEQVSGVQIEVIDSLSASLGIGFLVMLAAKLIEAGRDINDIIKILKKSRDNISIYFTVNDLSYLERGGRISKTQAFFGSILNIYPLLSIPGDDGRILPYEKIRGKKRIAKKLSGLINTELSAANNAWVAFIHGLDEMNNYQYFKESVLNNISKTNGEYLNFSNWISPVLGCHTGPSVYGGVVIKGDFFEL